MAQVFPDLLRIILDAAAQQGPWQHWRMDDSEEQLSRRANRLHPSHLPTFKPHDDFFYSFDWINHSDVVRKAMKVRDTPQDGKVEVKPMVVEMCGLLADDGPFTAITISRDVKAFESLAMTWAVDYKWKTYGFRIHIILIFIYIIGLVLFFSAQVALIVDRFGVRLLGEEHQRSVDVGESLLQ